jgi:hypothetical protein
MACFMMTWGRLGWLDSGRRRARRFLGLGWRGGAGRGTWADLLSCCRAPLGGLGKVAPPVPCDAILEGRLDRPPHLSRECGTLVGW